ncbi:unnamed protein product [Camellia sinensis]
MCKGVEKVNYKAQNKKREREFCSKFSILPKWGRDPSIYRKTSLELIFIPLYTCMEMHFSEQQLAQLANKYLKRKKNGRRPSPVAVRPSMWPTGHQCGRPATTDSRQAQAMADGLRGWPTNHPLLQI